MRQFQPLTSEPPLDPPDDPPECPYDDPDCSELCPCNDCIADIHAAEDLLIENAKETYR